MVRLVLSISLCFIAYSLWASHGFRSCELSVVTPHDGGLGSLRAAFADAGRCRGFATIRFYIDRTHLKAPLPVLANTEGVALIGLDQVTTIESVTSLQKPLISIISPYVTSQNLHLSGRRGVGLMFESERVKLVRTSLSNFEYGLVVNESDASVLVKGGEYSRNDHAIFTAQASRSLQVSDAVFSHSKVNALTLKSVNRVQIMGSSFYSNRIDVRGVVGDLLAQNYRSSNSIDASLYVETERFSLYDSSVTSNADHGLTVRGIGNVVIHNSELSAREVALRMPEIARLQLADVSLRGARAGALHGSNASVATVRLDYQGVGSSVAKMGVL